MQPPCYLHAEDAAEGHNLPAPANSKRVQGCASTACLRLQPAPAPSLTPTAQAWSRALTRWGGRAGWRRHGSHARICLAAAAHRRAVLCHLSLEQGQRGGPAGRDERQAVGLVADQVGLVPCGVPRHILRNCITVKSPSMLIIRRALEPNCLSALQRPTARTLYTHAFGCRADQHCSKWQVCTWRLERPVRPT